ncbi:MAG: RloB domain-containing protein [Magnetococcales bacterium]|nr:RloB domain-containing protein [Magnetococcales bacterium]
MALTTRKKRPVDQVQQPERDARLIVIATEGHKTEIRYFKLFGSKRLQVLVLPSKDDKSAPQHVLARLREFRETYQLDGEDELWLMIDVDRWPVKALSEVT